jgi:peptidoglycan/xylan/chitin deacetylase (PgdA/CDA1 family)
MSRQLILAFHGLGEPPAEIDADEKPYWIPVPIFETIVRKTASRPEVVYTFDDGNRSDVVEAVPILQRFGRTGSFFILTGRLYQPGYLSPDDIRAMQRLGMTIGLHGRDHVDWREASDDRLRIETIQARQELAELCGEPIEAVAIPFGAYNRRVMSHLQSCGFSAIMTTDKGYARGDHIVRNRTSIRSDMNEAAIDATLAGRSSPPAALKRMAATYLKRHIV